MNENFEASQQLLVVGDHTEQADNPRVGVGGGTPVGIVRKANTKNGFPSDYLVGFLEKHNFLPRRFVGKPKSGKAPQEDPPIFSLALNTHPGTNRPGTKPNEVTQTNTLATPVVRPDKDSAGKLVGSALLTDALQVVDDALCVVLQDTDPLSGSAAFFPSEGEKTGMGKSRRVLWRDVFDYMKQGGVSGLRNDPDVLGLRGTHLLADPRDQKLGYPWALGDELKPALAAHPDAVTLEGWVDQRAGLWRPFVAYIPLVPKDGKDGKDGAPGPQGPAGPPGGGGGGGGNPPWPLPPKNGETGEEEGDLIGPLSDPEEDYAPVELTPCDQPVPRGTGGGAPGDDSTTSVTPEEGAALDEMARAKRFGNEKDYEAARKRYEEAKKKADRERNKPGTQDGKPYVGSIAARTHPNAGKSKIKPRFSRLFNPKGDQRQLLGGGKYAPGAPSVPRGGIRQFDKFDFVPEIHTGWDVDNAIIDKANQVIAFVNDRFEGGPDKIRNIGLFLPAQELSKVRGDEFRDGSVIQGLVKINKRTYEVLHQKTRDTKGETTFAPISHDAMPERWLGSGDTKETVTIGIKEPLSNDRRAALVYDPKTRTITTRNADSVIEGTQTVLGEDGTENELETDAEALLNIKGRLSNGTEVTRTLRALDGDIAFTRESKSPKFLNGTARRTLDTASYTLENLADVLHTLAYDMRVTGTLSGWTATASSTYTLDLAAFTPNTVAALLATVVNDIQTNGYLSASLYRCTTPRTRFALDCDSFTLNQLGQTLCAFMAELGVSGLETALTGTANKMVRFTATGIGDSGVEDNGTTVSTARNLTVTGATTTGDTRLAYVTATASNGGNHNVNSTTATVFVNAFSLGTTNNYDVTLPSAVTYAGRRINVKIVEPGSGSSTVTVKSTSGSLDQVAASTGVPMDATAFSKVAYQSDGTNWWSV